MTRNSRIFSQGLALGVLLLLLSVTPSVKAAFFSVPEPNSAELSPPSLTIPGMGHELSPSPPRTLAQCTFSVSPLRERIYDLYVLKDTFHRYGRVVERAGADSKDSSFPYVYSQTLTKDMLGQYAAAVDAAHALGITQVDSLRVYVVDPDPNSTKTIVLFYDEDGILLDRWGGIGSDWRRCE